MVEHNPLEESTSFILMKHFVFFITFAKIANWIDPEVNLKNKKKMSKSDRMKIFFVHFSRTTKHQIALFQNDFLNYLHH